MTQSFGALGPSPGNPLTVHTAGWVRVLEVDSDFATAQVLHACEGMLTGDFLEPYAAPLLAAITRSTASRTASTSAAC